MQWENGARARSYGLVGAENVIGENRIEMHKYLTRKSAQNNVPQATHLRDSSIDAHESEILYWGVALEFLGILARILEFLDENINRNNFGEELQG